MKFTRTKPLLLILLFAFVSCKKSDNTTTTIPVVQPFYPDVNTGANVYLVGTTTGAYPNNTTFATYWKNGVATILENTLSDLDSEADAIALSGDDVYIAGKVHIGTNETAVLWKNNKITRLVNVGSQANAIAIDGTNVYVAGSIGDAAVYWKNGVATELPVTISFTSQANAIAVSGTDVYMAGFTFPYNGNPEALIWKNGVASVLSGSSAGTVSIANGIALSGNDVYVVGFTGAGAAIWKNGVLTNLTPETNFSVATAIVINGTDVYVAGNVKGTPVYWKNGVVTLLKFSPTGSGNEQANSLAMNGSDLFIGGGFDPAGDNTLYWWNSTPVKLTPGIGAINGIAVTPK